MDKLLQKTQFYLYLSMFFATVRHNFYLKGDKYNVKCVSHYYPFYLLLHLPKRKMRQTFYKNIKI